MSDFIRAYIRGLLTETYFPLTGGDKLRIHHSRKGTRIDGLPQVDGFEQKVGPKPNGLWYECQDGSAETWKEFCTGAFSIGYKYDETYNVNLNDYNILFIPDAHHFEKFYDMYSTNHPAGVDYDRMIDWPRVAQDYAGIEICPYLWSKRNDENSFWYYGWDVASGCVWNSSGIKKLDRAGDCK
jgi:hypothetical protein